MSQLTQIQTVRRSSPNAKEVFIYHKANGFTSCFPFRVGDIVRVTDWGCCYSSYTKAYIYFTNNTNTPYYCGITTEITKRRKEDGDKQCFKIINIAEHGQGKDIVCYIQDRAKRGVVIGPEGLKLVKQFPLRKNETINIVLEKINKYMIYSILDTDLYKFSMSNAYFQLYRDAEGTFTFNDRNNEVYDKKFIEMLQLEFARLCQLKLTAEEYAYISSIRYLSTNYTEWLKGFHFELDKIKFWLDDDGHLHIEVTDKMYKVTLYEVPILAIVAECRNKWLGVKLDIAKIIDILDKKIDFANEHQLYFSEFGTRRRASAASHEAIVKRLKERCPIYCVGTSNVYFAMKYNMMPSGTCAHEWIMFHAGIGGFKTANLTALNDWIKVYQGDLGISLIDTYTTASYLHTLTMKQAKLLDGFRQDSGDEFKIGNMIIDKLRELRIDPTSKTIVFSNALTFEKYAEIARYFKGRIKVAAGIGTNLTCDLGIEGYRPANIVMKLSKCRYSPRDFWEFVIKISDDLGKHMGHKDLFDIAAKELHFRELGIEIKN